MTRREDSRIQSAEMYVLTMIIGKTSRDRLRNERISEEIRVKAMLNKMDAARLRWWGHLERMEERRGAKRRWEWRSVGTRPKGRPRKRWKDSVKESLRRHRMPSMQELMEERVLENRREWRRVMAPLTGS